MGGMQRIYPCGLTVEQYVAMEGQRQVVAETVCPNCGEEDGLWRHGVYGRYVTTGGGEVVEILVARFWCRRCRGTVSYLPAFALSYRLVNAEAFEAYLDGDYDRLAVRRWEELLRGYGRQMRAFTVELIRTIGCGLGLSPPKPGGLWPWLREACGGLASAARELVTRFRTGLFRRYQCHQPAA